VTLYIAVPLVLLALFYAATGVAAVTRGWMLPMNRRRVHAPRVYGWGQLMVAFALCWQTAFGLLIGDSDTLPSAPLIGSAILVAGFIVMMVGQRAGGTRKRGGTP
jgi:drug/metabolite transporter superfamily protein YnfA